MEQIRLSDCRTYYIATVIKTVWCQRRQRCRDQWTRVEKPELYPCKYAQWISEHKQFRGGRVVFQTSGAEITEHSQAEK